MPLKYPVHFYPRTLREMLEFLMPGKQYIRLENAAGRRIKEVTGFRPTGQGDSPAFITFCDGTFALIFNGDPATDLRLFSRVANPITDLVRLGILNEKRLNAAAALQQKLESEESEIFLAACRCGRRPMIRNLDTSTAVECLNPGCARTMTETTAGDTEDDLIQRIRKVIKRWNTEMRGEP